MTDITYTRDQVSDAASEAVSLIASEGGVSDRDIDLLNLMVNATLTLLDLPAADLDQVINTCYDGDPVMVRGWIA